MAKRTPIEVFPPGEFIRDELEERGWTQAVLADVLGVSERLVSEIIRGRRGISPGTAQVLGEAFDTGPLVWMNLESAYLLSQLSTSDDSVARRARLHDRVPLKNMIKRLWIEPSSSIDVLEERVRRFFGVSSLDEEPAAIPHAARKSTSYETVTMAQHAWLRRARALAEAVSAVPYTERRLQVGLENLRTLLGDVEEVRRVPAVLAEAGVRLVLVEQLPGTKIDGAAFWLNARSPVIALSLRFDRVDGFWYTLLHDAMHIRNGDVKPKGDPILDVRLVGDDAVRRANKPPDEQRADAEAADFLVPEAKLQDFIARVRPLYSKRRIRAFAATIGVHPGIVVGQLQHRGEVPFSHSRDMLQGVREIISQAALTDGWGHSPQLGE